MSLRIYILPSIESEGTKSQARDGSDTGEVVTHIHLLILKAGSLNVHSIVLIQPHSKVNDVAGGQIQCTPRTRKEKPITIHPVATRPA